MVSFSPLQNTAPSAPQTQATPGVFTFGQQAAPTPTASTTPQAPQPATAPQTSGGFNFTGATQPQLSFGAAPTQPAAAATPFTFG